MGVELDALKAAVEKTSVSIQKAIALLNDLKGKLDAAVAANDPAALVSAAQQLNVDSDVLDQTVVADTPTQP